MMIITTNILALPVVLLLWSLDAFVTLASVRLLLGQLAADWAGRASSGLAPLTDWAPAYLQRLLEGKFRFPVRSWVAWLVIIGVALAIRQALVGALLAVSHAAAP